MISSRYLVLLMTAFFAISSSSLSAGLGNLLEPVKDTSVDVEETIITLDEVSVGSSYRKKATPLDKITKISDQKGTLALGVKAPPEAPRVYEVTELEVAASIKERLIEHYNPEGQLKVFLKRSFKGVKAKSPNWNLNIVEYPSEGLESNILLRVEIWSEGERDGTWSVPLRCELWKEGYISNKQISRNQVLNREDFSMQYIDILRNRFNIVEASSDLSNYESMQTISGGRPLTWRDVRTRPAIRRGDFVEVVASEGMLRISMRGIALEDGVVDDFIAIKNVQSKKNIEAQVVNASTVKVFF